jgi:hypothetical protein
MQRRPHAFVVCEVPPLDREDVTTIMETLFDLRVGVDQILDLLEWDDDEEEEADSDT